MFPSTSSLCRLVGLLLMAVLLAACGGKAAKTPPIYTGKNEIADMRNFPQDLTAYVKKDGNRAILSKTEAREALEKYRSRLFSSWHMNKPSISQKDASMLLRRKARGWKDGSRAWTNAEWTAMRTNGNMQTYPNVNKPGIVLRNTSLREMPTHLPRFTKPTPDPLLSPFDYFQYSALHVGMPVLLCHISKDRRWYYVETPLAAGWVDARDLAPVSEPFIALWEGRPLAAIVKENTVLGDSKNTADIGAILPAAGVNAVMIPYRGKDGLAAMRKVEVAEGSVEPMPLVMTPANVARIGNAMMGQDYGWGGMLGLRDCSAMTRDILAPFGIWLPRNSQAQARAGERISLRGKTASQSEQIIKKHGVPFASLVVLNGHVVFYVGTYKGRAMIMHDLWGVRVDEPEGEDNRLIVGRVIVSTVMPGKELPNLPEGRKTMGDRFHTLTILGGAASR